MANLAILGHPTRGKEVIEILEMLGGKNTYAKELSVMCKTLLDAIENFNNTRHWWERKIKIDNVL